MERLVEPLAAAAVGGVVSICVAALAFTGPWALPLALVGVLLIRPGRSNVEEGEEKEKEG